MSGAFSVDTSTTGDAVTPVDVDQLITGDLPDPELKRHERLARYSARPGWPRARHLAPHRWRLRAGPATDPVARRSSGRGRDGSQQPIDGRPVVARGVFKHGLSFSRVRRGRTSIDTAY